MGSNTPFKRLHYAYSPTYSPHCVDSIDAVKSGFINLHNRISFAPPTTKENETALLKHGPKLLRRLSDLGLEIGRAHV